MSFDKDRLDPELQSEPQEELSHTDKILGIFTNPVKTFEQIAAVKLRFIDWLIPFFGLVIVLVLGQGIKLSNPEVKYQFVEQTIHSTEIALDKYAKVPPEQKEKILDETRSQMQGNSYLIRFGISVTIMFALFLFIPALIYYLFGQVFFKGNGSYQSALIGSSLPNYITMIGVLLSAVLALITKNYAADFSLYSLIKPESNYYLKLLFSMVDPFGIWANVVSAIAFTKLYKLKSYVPMSILVAVLYILFKFFFFQG